jgi:hypothetical protein
VGCRRTCLDAISASTACHPLLRVLPGTLLLTFIPSSSSSNPENTFCSQLDPELSTASFQEISSIPHGKPPFPVQPAGQRKGAGPEVLTSDGVPRTLIGYIGGDFGVPSMCSPVSGGVHILLPGAGQAHRPGHCAKVLGPPERPTEGVTEQPRARRSTVTGVDAGGLLANSPP